MRLDTDDGINQILAPDSICWVCGPGSPNGLMLSYRRTATGVITQWWADPRYEGATGRLHNGFAAALLEDAAGWAAMSKLHARRGALTPVRILELQVIFKEPIPSRRVLTVTGNFSSEDAGVMHTTASLDCGDKVLATASSRLALPESADAQEA